ncbi:hypothetical protein AAE478_005186 [Parahypoxylon ruwenzoriense]
MSLGPLTTSFTPPADCVTSSALYWVNTQSTFYWLHGRPSQSSCFPDNYSPYQNQYYSPGICPASYTRACEAPSSSDGTMVVTRATCCPQGNYVCAQTSSSYSYPWGPTLGCMSVYRVDTETSFTTVNGTLQGDETAGDLTSLRAPGTIMAYGVVIQNGPATATMTEATATVTPGSVTDSSLQSQNSAIASETATAGSQSNSSSGGGGGGGISPGAAAGVGIGVAVGIMAIGGMLVWLFWARRRRGKQEAIARGTADGQSPSLWSSTTWVPAPAPAPYPPPTVQVNWPPSELANEREPKEMSAETRFYTSSGAGNPNLR